MCIRDSQLAGDNGRPFDGVTACAATKQLRRMLRLLGTSDHRKFGTQSCRQGSTMDLLDNDVPIQQVLANFGWEETNSETIEAHIALLCDKE